MPAGRLSGSRLRQATIRVVEGGGDARVELGGKRELPVVSGLGNALLDEPAGEHAVHRGAEVVDIGLLVDHLLDGLFRGHELRRSLDPVLWPGREPRRCRSRSASPGRSSIA